MFIAANRRAFIFFILWQKQASGEA